MEGSVFCLEIHHNDLSAWFERLKAAFDDSIDLFAMVENHVTHDEVRLFSRVGIDITCVHGKLVWSVRLFLELIGENRQHCWGVVDENNFLTEIDQTEANEACSAAKIEDHRALFNSNIGHDIVEECFHHFGLKWMIIPCFCFVSEEIFLHTIWQNRLSLF